MTFYYDKDEVTMSKDDLQKLVDDRDELITACKISLQYIESICFNTPNEKKRKNYDECVRIIRKALSKAGAI